MSVTAKKSRSFNVGTLIVLHLLIVLPLAYFLNVWADEASTLYTTQNGFWRAFQNAATEEKQAPLYFWIMSLWRSIDNSIFFSRLFSVICSVVAIKVFADLTRRSLAPRAALLATAFFAFHPFLIWASVEVRVYSLVILLSLLLVRFFSEVFLNNADARTEWKQWMTKRTVLFSVVAVVALYTNYYLGFLLVGFFAALLARGKWRESAIYLGLMFVAAIAFVPLLIGLQSQFLANTSGFREATSLIEGIRTLWHHFLTFTLPAEVFPDVQVSVADMVRVWVVRVVLALTGIYVVVKRKSISSHTLIFGWLMSVVFGCLLFAYFVVGSEYVAIRHASVAFAPLILFLSSLLSDIFSGDNGKEKMIGNAAVFAGGVLVLASFSYALVTLFPNMAKRGDWARVAAFIEQNETAGQPIIVFTAFESLALPYHYKGVNKIFPDEKFFDFELESAFGSENSYIRQTDFVISEIPSDVREIWLAVSEKCIVTDACRPLENYVRANYTIEKEQEFYLEKLFLLRKKTQ